MANKLIATDHPLTSTQQRTLAALVDTILPGSTDGKMPSAKELDFIGHISGSAETFVDSLVEIVDSFDSAFSTLSLADRYSQVQAFSHSQSDSFKQLLFHVYDCYYTDERVTEAIGMGKGSPFPRGNTLDAGDLSLLDPVVAKPRTYRK